MTASVTLRGRSDEMGRALAVLRGAVRHGLGATVVISGPSGIGKTALTREICGQARALRMRVVAATCDPTSPLRAGEVLVSALRTGPRPVADADQYARLAGAADDPLLLAEAVAGLLEDAAAAAPVLLALDDAQWADATTAFVLRRVRVLTAGLPLVVVLATRSPDPRTHQALDAADTIHHLPLRPLRDDEVMAVARDRLGYRPDERVRALLAATHGNALLVTSLLDQLTSSAGDLAPAAASMSTVWRSRWDALPEPAAGVAALVAASGAPLHLDDLGELTGRTRSELDVAVGAAAVAGLLLVEDGEVSYRHDLVREAVVTGVPPARRRVLHRQLANWHQAHGRPLQAATHASDGIEAGDTDAAEVMLTAAEQLVGELPAEAAGLAFRAYGSLPVTAAGWLTTGERALAVLARAQRPLVAVEVADALLADIDDPDRAGAVEVQAASALWWSGRLRTLVDRVDRALARVPAPGPVVNARLRAVRALARTRLVEGATAATEAAAALDLAEAVDDPEAIALAQQAAGEAAKNEGRHADSLRHFRALRVSRDVGAVAEEVMALQLLDRYDDAQALLDRARTEHGDSSAVLPSLLFAQTWQAFNLAAFDDAETHAVTLVELGQELGNGVHTLESLMILAAIRLSRADLPGCAAYLERAGALTDADDDIRLPGLTLMRGWYRAETGDPHGALDVLRPMVFTARESRTYWPWWPGWMNVMFAVAAAAGDRNAAVEAVELAELGAARNPGVTTFSGIAVQLRGLLLGDLTRTRRGAEISALSPRPMVRAGARMVLGRALLQAGHTAAALAELDAAWDLYDAVGATQSRIGVQQVMQATGARRRKWTTTTARPTTGWEALTAAEVRVAELIAAGATNRSAAEMLGLSVNTVGTHLNSVFGKLDVHSRVQLANLVSTTLTDPSTSPR